MNAWMMIFSVAAVVFASRFLLLEPWLPIKLSQNVQDILKFSAPAVLTAIATPIVLFREQEISIALSNHHLVASVVVVVLSLITRSTLLTVMSGMGTFLLLRFVL